MLSGLPDLIIIATFLTAILFTGLGFYLNCNAARKHAYQPANDVMLRSLLFVAALWLATLALTTITPAPPWKLHWNALYYALLIILPSLWTLFVLEFSGVSGQVLRRLRLLLALEPVLMIGLMATTEWHGLFWQEWQTMPFGTHSLIRTTYGPVATLHALYSDFLLMFATSMLLRIISDPAHARRKPAIRLIIASVAPWLLMIYGSQQAASLTVINGLLPLVMLVSCGVILTGIVKSEAAWVIPIARKAIVDKMDDGIIVLDRTGAIVDVNPAACQIFQKSHEALLGQPAIDVFAATPGVHENYMVDTLYRSQLQFDTPEGKRHYALQVTALRDDNDTLSGQLISLHDITEHVKVESALKQARKAAETANRTKSEFLANMSHELRTPLNAIIGYTDLTLMGTYGDITPLQKERLEQVSENGKHLADLIGDLIDISRIEAHDFPLHLETFDPAPLLNDAVRNAEQVAANKNLQVHASISDALPMITADARRLSQVVSHLIQNALKFTPEGYIILHAGVIKRRDTLDFPMQLPTAPRRWLLIAVQDTGIGIAHEDQSTIFEDFRQVDGSHTRHYAGSGLGLTVAYRFTRLMNGHMWVESSLNQGSTMYVLMPVFESPEELDLDSIHNEDDPPLRHFMPHLN